MIERERFESWARQRWTHPEDFDQRIKAPSKYNNYEVQAAWDAWQERAAQPAPRAPDGVAEALQRLIENGAVLGPASSEDALLVARYRQRLLSSAPRAPDGWQLVPTAESRHPGIYKMLGALHAADNTPGMSEWESYRAMLSEAPEVKP